VLFPLNLFLCLPDFLKSFRRRVFSCQPSQAVLSTLPPSSFLEFPSSQLSEAVLKAGEEALCDDRAFKAEVSLPPLLNEPHTAYVRGRSLIPKMLPLF